MREKEHKSRDYETVRGAMRKRDNACVTEKE